jgi:hypothetical protein
MPPNPTNRLSDFEVFVLAILAVPAILIALFILLVMAEKFKLGWHEVPVHYRLSFGVEVGGVVYSGSTVAQVLYQHIPQWQVINGPGVAALEKGQASCVKLADGRMICLLPEGENLVRGGKYY